MDVALEKNLLFVVKEITQTSYKSCHGQLKCETNFYYYSLHYYFLAYVPYIPGKKNNKTKQNKTER